MILREISSSDRNFVVGKVAFDSKDFFGKILIKHKQGKSEIEIPYWATVFEGGLYYNASVTKYLTDKGSADTGSRNFTVVNKYEYPLAITNISLPDEAQQYFSVCLPLKLPATYVNCAFFPDEQISTSNITATGICSIVSINVKICRCVIRFEIKVFLNGSH